MLEPGGASLGREMEPTNEASANGAGTLTVAAAPIGQPADASGRLAPALSDASLIAIAQRANTANKADDALAYLNANLEYYPKSARTYVTLAQVKNGKGDKAGAIAALEKAIDLDPNNAQAKAQLDTRANMTDVLAALTVLADLDRPERPAALARFYAAWSRDELVIDKWFALQARSSLPGTANRVRELTLHPAFERKNPNRVRALVGPFAQGNQIGFHDASGAGYAFLADEVITLDPINPTTAARLPAATGPCAPSKAASMRAACAAVPLPTGPAKSPRESDSRSPCTPWTGIRPS